MVYDSVDFGCPKMPETVVWKPLFTVPIASCDHDHRPLLQEPLWLRVSLVASYQRTNIALVSTDVAEASRKWSTQKIEGNLPITCWFTHEYQTNRASKSCWFKRILRTMEKEEILSQISIKFWKIMNNSMKTNN